MPCLLASSYTHIGAEVGTGGYPQDRHTQTARVGALSLCSSLGVCDVKANDELGQITAAPTTKTIDGISPQHAEAKPVLEPMFGKLHHKNVLLSRYGYQTPASRNRNYMSGNTAPLVTRQASPDDTSMRKLDSCLSRRYFTSLKCTIKRMACSTVRLAPGKYFRMQEQTNKLPLITIRTYVK